MLITLEFKNVKVTVEGELYIDGESTEIVVTDPCVDGKFELSYTVRHSPFKKIDDGYTNREIADAMKLSTQYINDVRKCASPRYANLQFKVDGWPSVRELRKIKSEK